MDRVQTGEFTVADENAIWYRQPWVLEFDARVQDTLLLREKDGRAALGIVLDTKGFFPGGGGQPCDLGTIAGVSLCQVREAAGRILHIVERERWEAVFPGTLPERGRDVHCVIDSERRNDFAQQHTGEHILAACLKKAIDVDAVSVHFGAEYSTIETLARDIREEDLLAVEDAANAVLARGEKVSCHWIDAGDIGRYPVRRSPDVRGRVHIVQIGGADTCACCGVHLCDTSSLGRIIITGTEKIRGRTRLFFITGGRVGKAFHAMHGILGRLRVLLSCSDMDLPRAVESLLEEKRETGRMLGEARSQLFRHEAADLARRSREWSPAAGVRARFIKAFLPGASPRELSDFAAHCLETGSALACVCDASGTAAQDGGRVSWILAHNLGVSPDLKQLVSPLVSSLGGKGGGSSLRFQGSFADTRGYAAFIEKVQDALGLSAGDEAGDERRGLNQIHG
jgi:alanyl-tRNA synthetase